MLFVTGTLYVCWSELYEHYIFSAAHFVLKRVKCKQNDWWFLWKWYWKYGSVLYFIMEPKPYSITECPEYYTRDFVGLLSKWIHVIYSPYFHGSACLFCTDDKMYDYINPVKLPWRIWINRRHNYTTNWRFNYIMVGLPNKIQVNILTTWVNTVFKHDLGLAGLLCC